MDEFEKHYNILYDFLDGNESEQIELENNKKYLRGFFELGMELGERKLEKELRRERKTVDYYANPKNYEMNSLDCLNKIKEKDMGWCDYIPPFRVTILSGGKLARETQKKREVSIND